ncbi:transposase [Rhodococcus qingshengii]|uniref:transposase n=1 Tax=Rhodococcus qingshengii TaxID=334542 RepID=UPI0035D8DE71
MPKPFPEEFRRDVVAIAHKREAPPNQSAKDLGNSEPTLRNWHENADIEDGGQPGTTKEESAELRELRKRN